MSADSRLPLQCVFIESRSDRSDSEHRSWLPGTPCQLQCNKRLLSARAPPISEDLPASDIILRSLDKDQRCVVSQYSEPMDNGLCPSPFRVGVVSRHQTAGRLPKKEDDGINDGKAYAPAPSMWLLWLEMFWLRNQDVAIVS
jgi:hypothetical protein